jgi:hypothetical protein
MAYRLLLASAFIRPESKKPQAAAALPSSVMNSRLFNGNISRASNRKIPHLAGAEDLLHCGISIRRLSDVGQTRSFGDVDSMSELLPKAVI